VQAGSNHQADCQPEQGIPARTMLGGSGLQGAGGAEQEMQGEEKGDAMGRDCLNGGTREHGRATSRCKGVDREPGGGGNNEAEGQEGLMGLGRARSRSNSTAASLRVVTLRRSSSTASPAPIHVPFLRYLGGRERAKHVSLQRHRSMCKRAEPRPGNAELCADELR